MYSEAEETRYEDVEPHGDVKAEQRLPGKASAAYLGQDVHQATSGSLPVPTLVEPDAPPSQGVEPDEYPTIDMRNPCGLTFGWMASLVDFIHHTPPQPTLAVRPSSSHQPKWTQFHFDKKRLDPCTTSH